MNTRKFKRTAIIAAATAVSITSFFCRTIPTVTYTTTPNKINTTVHPTDNSSALTPNSPVTFLPNTPSYETILSESEPDEIHASDSTRFPSETYFCPCTIPASTEPPMCLSHTFGPWKTATYSTCITDGSEVRCCSVCGEVESRVIKAEGHLYQCIDVQNPTVSNVGYKLFRCSKCRAEYTQSLPKLSVIDADMCSESLLEQALPNAPYPAFTQEVVSRWAAQLDYDEAVNAGAIPMPEAGTREILRSWEIAYRYLTVPYSYTTFLDADGSRVFNCWVMPGVAAKQKEVYTQVAKILEELGIDSTVTKKEAVARINRWICDFKYYDYSSEEPDPTPYHSLLNPDGKCHNYALAFQLLCLGAGIECHYYSSQTMNHAWNKVYFSDGSFLWVDVTWNDTSDSTRYLLIDTNTLCKDHSL